MITLKKIFLILLFLLFPISAMGGEYYAYFSDGGTGSTPTGCASGTPCDFNVTNIQAVIDHYATNDTLHIYGNGGDTLTWTSNSSDQQGIIVDPTDPITYFESYGTGKTIYYGGVSDFSTEDPHNASGGPYKWSRMFDIQREYCKIDGIIAYGFYGNVVFLNDNVGSSDHFKLLNSEIYEFGSCVITSHTDYGTTYVEVAYNKMYTGQQLMRYDLVPGWGGAITLRSKNKGAASYTGLNHVHHNIVYDIFGEGIFSSSSTVEYNIVGDTASVGIFGGPTDFDPTEEIIRYNWVVFSNHSTSVYDSVSAPGFGSGNSEGIRMYDDIDGGDNSTADVHIYGNIVINRTNGIEIYGNEDLGPNWGSIKVYDNTVIDSEKWNFYFANCTKYDDVDVYNNASIYFDSAGSTGAHIRNWDSSLPDDAWDFSDNLFYPASGAYSVLATAQTNMETGDPLLPGEPSVNWTNLNGSPYYNTISVAIHLMQSELSPLNGNGKDLSGGGYYTDLLGPGTDFSTLPTGDDFVTSAQSGTFNIGALKNVYEAITENVNLLGGIGFSGVTMESK